MKARMVHIGNKQISQAYSVHDEHINAVDRAKLNELLLDAAEKMEGVSVYFDHRITGVDLDNNTLEFKTRENEVKHAKVDWIIGADGAYSKVRSEMMRRMRLNFDQEYIDTGYCELYMPPKVESDGTLTFALDPNHLHIWPRHTFMLIALPNPDFSFTCTLFMPFKMFEDIDTEEKLMDFFRENFNDSIPLIGEKELLNDYFSNPRGSLITVKLSPHHYDDKALLVGDAAHAMVPFYGQGMNCGFQDIEVLHEILDKHAIRPIVVKSKIPGLDGALEHYSHERVKDAHAICDLAMYNHYEMRHAVTSMRFIARKKMEGYLHLVFPRLVIPLYSMVSFSTLPYSRAISRWHRQNYWINMLIATSLVSTVSITSFLGFRHRHSLVSNIRDVIQSIKNLC
ncbi:hypothetical protein BDB01DRAFT_843161 [Pilobolus umbonatus]|nr:hypothetical protein BDB01DRAFT_843161 [Pilobolus umbonatus]